MTVLYAIIALIVAAVIVAKLYLCIAGKEKIVVKTDAPFVVESQTDDAIVISKKLTFVNEGKQCATIMDALVRMSSTMASRHVARRSARVNRARTITSRPC